MSIRLEKLNKELTSTFGEDSGKWLHLITITAESAQSDPILFNKILS